MDAPHGPCRVLPRLSHQIRRLLKLGSRTDAAFSLGAKSQAKNLKLSRRSSCCTRHVVQEGVFVHRVRNELSGESLLSPSPLIQTIPIYSAPATLRLRTRAITTAPVTTAPQPRTPTRTTTQTQTAATTTRTPTARRTTTMAAEVPSTPALAAVPITSKVESPCTAVC